MSSSCVRSASSRASQTLPASSAAPPPSSPLERELPSSSESRFLRFFFFSFDFFGRPSSASPSRRCFRFRFRSCLRSLPPLALPLALALAVRRPPLPRAQSRVELAVAARGHNRSDERALARAALVVRKVHLEGRELGVGVARSLAPRRQTGPCRRTPPSRCAERARRRPRGPAHVGECVLLARRAWYAQPLLPRAAPSSASREKCDGPRARRACSARGPPRLQRSQMLVTLQRSLGRAARASLLARHARRRGARSQRTGASRRGATSTLHSVRRALAAAASEVRTRSRGAQSRASDRARDRRDRARPPAVRIARLSSTRGPMRPPPPPPRPPLATSRHRHRRTATAGGRHARSVHAPLRGFADDPEAEHS